MLRRKRDANLIQLMDFPAGSGKPLVDLLPRMDQMDMVQGIVHHAFQQGLGHIRRQIGVNCAVIAGTLEAFIGKRQHSRIGHAQLGVVLLYHLLRRDQDHPLDQRIFFSNVFKRDAAKPLDAHQVLARYRIVFKVSNNGQSMRGRYFTSFSQSSGIHCDDSNLTVAGMEGGQILADNSRPDRRYRY